jgi:hypothetical protein
MKKLLAIIAVIAGVFVLVTCSKPKITKEQQENVVMRIGRKYDFKEIEFMSLTKDMSTGSYSLKLKINNDSTLETVIIFDKLEFLNIKTGFLVLNPVNRFYDFERNSVLDDDTQNTDIKIKYLE